MEVGGTTHTDTPYNSKIRDYYWFQKGVDGNHTPCTGSKPEAVWQVCLFSVSSSYNVFYTYARKTLKLLQFCQPFFFFFFKQVETWNEKAFQKSIWWVTTNKTWWSFGCKQKCGMNYFHIQKLKLIRITEKFSLEAVSQGPLIQPCAPSEAN